MCGRRASPGGSDELVRTLSDAGGIAVLAHLGGAAIGYLYFRKGDVVGRYQVKRKVAKAAKTDREHETNRREMDRILTKIQATGLGSLDTKEREYLNQRSRNLRDGRK